MDIFSSAQNNSRTPAIDCDSKEIKMQLVYQENEIKMIQLIAFPWQLNLYKLGITYDSKNSHHISSKNGHHIRQ